MIKQACIVAAFALAATAVQAAPAVIDGVISPGEWTGATSVVIGNGGGTGYLKADNSYIYAALDITGWSAASGVGSIGNLLGFGVWKVNGGAFASAGVEFQQSTNASLVGPTPTLLNGLLSGWRVTALSGGTYQTAYQASLPADLMAMDSFATGHRVWELKVPISLLGASPGDTIYVAGGIDYDAVSHWYPDYALTSGFTQFAPVTLPGGPVPVPVPGSLALIGTALLGLGVARGRTQA